MNNNSFKSAGENNQTICTRKFETAEGQIENSYLCGQSKFTSADFWNVFKQRREFTRRSLNGILN